tara:strand:- start:2242 stop:2751 length:510 start_codon:yes stop_codon:yes gene_type:complete
MIYQLLFDGNQFPIFLVRIILLKVNPRAIYTIRVITDDMIFVVINLLWRFGAIVGATANMLYKKNVAKLKIPKTQNHKRLLPGSDGLLPPSNFIMLAIAAAINKNKRDATAAKIYVWISKASSCLGVFTVIILPHDDITVATMTRKEGILNVFIDVFVLKLNRCMVVYD